MNKEQAKIYINNTNVKKAISRKFQYEFLLCNLALLILAIAFYRGIVFVIIVASMALIYTIIIIILTKKKPNFFSVNILSAIHITILCITFNCWVYGMNQQFGSFILWEFLVSVGIQFAAFVCSFVLVKKHAEKFKPKERLSKAEIAAGTAAGFSFALARVLLRIFSPSLNVVIGILTVLVNIIGILSSLGIVALFYKAYLIKKYGLATNGDDEIVL